MSDIWEDMIIKMAAEEYLKDENKKMQDEMDNIDEVFYNKAAQNDQRFHKALNKEFRTKKKWNINRETKHSKVVYSPIFCRIIICVAIILLIFNISLFTVPGVKSALVDFVNRTRGVYTDVLRDGENDTDVANQDLKDEFGFDKEYRITYLPQGMQLVDYGMTPLLIIYNYVGENDSYINFSQGKDAYTTNIDTEAGKVSTIDIQGNQVMIVEKGKALTLIYEIEHYSIKLESGGIPMEEFQKIAQSIQAIE